MCTNRNERCPTITDCFHSCHGSFHLCWWFAASSLILGKYTELVAAIWRQSIDLHTAGAAIYWERLYKFAWRAETFLYDVVSDRRASVRLWSIPGQRGWVLRHLTHLQLPRCWWIFWKMLHNGYNKRFVINLRYFSYIVIQHGIQFLRLLKALYTLLPIRLVQWNSISIYCGKH